MALLQLHHTDPKLAFINWHRFPLRHRRQHPPPLLPTAHSSSLPINYLPAKFGAGLVSRRRYGKSLRSRRCPSKAVAVKLSKRTNSLCPVSTTKTTVVNGVQFGPNSKKPVLRWTRFKWIMFIANNFVRPSDSTTSLRFPR